MENAKESSLTGSRILLQPIGLVKTQAPDDEVRAHFKQLISTIVIFPQFYDGLDGLKGFSHILVLSYLHRLRPEQEGVLKVKPSRLLRKGFKPEEIPTVGVFALDSPSRPNSIGLSLAKLLDLEDGRLTVLGLDCFDGTPVLDIKPYRDDYRAENYTLAEWYRLLREKAGIDF